MQSTAIPLRYAKVWGANADPAYIRTVPINSQIGTQDGAASFQTGFVPDNFTPEAAGGVPPFGQDFNGVFNIDTAWMQFLQAGGSIPYDATFATAIGGYPQGAVLASTIVAGARWLSTADNNSTNPDDPTTSANWIRQGLPVGIPLPFFGAVPTGFISMNNSASPFTIGNASSGASYAAADALFLFGYNWSSSLLAIYTSGGTVTTRGANATADFNAGKRLAMPDMRGATLIGVDNGSSNLSGVPVNTGNTTTPISSLGGNGVSLTGSQNGPHQHAVFLKDNQHRHTLPYFTTTLNDGTQGALNWPIQNAGSDQSSLASANITIGSVSGTANDNQTASAGSGASHNNVGLSVGANWGQKL